MNESEIQAAVKTLCGYEVGQKVFYRKANYEREPCETCDGTHKLITKLNGEDLQVECPRCNANGEVELEPYYTAESDEIRSIYITVTNVHPERIYGAVEVRAEPTFYLLNRSWETRPKDLYLTAEDAIAGQ